MKRVTFHGPAHVLRVAGQEIRRGESADVPDGDAETLLAFPKADVTIEGVEQPEAEGGAGQPTEEKE